MLYHDSGITLTITTCKRLSYFEQTIEAFKTNCLDWNKISRVIVSDDRSSDDDRNKMKEKHPDFEFIWHDIGHPRSLNVLFKMVDTPFFFHLEDDRVLAKPIKLLDASLRILQEEEIHSIITGRKIGGRSGKVIRSAPFDYYIHEFIEDGQFSSNDDLGNTSWPGFLLVPGLHDTAAVQSIEYKGVSQHERNFALQYQTAGYKVAFAATDYLFKHMREISAYNITGHRR